MPIEWEPTGPGSQKEIYELNHKRHEQKFMTIERSARGCSESVCMMKRIVY